MNPIGRSVIATLFLSAMSVSGCAQLDREEVRARLSGADQSIGFGDYGSAESLLSEYVYRDEMGALKLHPGLRGEARNGAVDTVVRLLWETGRDETLGQFAKEYLSGREQRITLCRIAERQARFDEAYSCWNGIGEVDRAERVLRTDAAVRILAQP